MSAMTFKNDGASEPNYGGAPENNFTQGNSAESTPAQNSPYSASQGWNQPRTDPSAANAGGIGSTGSTDSTDITGNTASTGGAHSYGAPSNYEQYTGYGQDASHSATGQSAWTGTYGGQRYGADSFGGSASGPSTGAGYGSAEGTAGAATLTGPAVTPLGEVPAKKKRTVGLGGALALMLAGSVVTGSIVGVAVGHDDNSNNASTSMVNEALNQPVAAEKPAAAEGSIESVAARVLPAVVAIQVATNQSVSEGSGSVISPDGYVLTNHHVVADAENGGGLIQVTMNDGTKHEASVVASDVNTDVAVIKIADVTDLPYLQFGDSSQLAVGQEVVAVGWSLGLNATVTSGIVSALNRPVRASQEGGESSLIDAIQTDAAVNPGNSGGPLVDMNGNIVGMNSVIASLSQSTGSESGSIGLGFAIPSNFAKKMADQLINNGSVKHPMLGVQVSARQLVDGAQIQSVTEGSPAADAGLRAGDIITRVNDRVIDSADALIAATRSQDFGATVTLEVKSEGSEETRQVEVTLTSE